MTTTSPSLNIASHLATMARQQPTTDALLTSLRRSSHNQLSATRTTFQQLNTLSDNLAHGLANAGIAPGHRTALLLKPGVDFFATTFALFKLGAIPVLIDPGIGLKNFGRCLAQAKPSAFIGIPLAHLLRRVLGWSKKTVTTNITTKHFGGIPLTKLQRTPAQDAIKNQKSKIKNDSPEAAILFTSGSTGPAKGVLYTHANFQAQIDALKTAYHIQPGEIDLATFPLFGLFGPALGMTTVIPTMNFTRPGFVDPRNILDPIRQFHITNMFASPALLARVAAYGKAHQIKLPSLYRVISAGAPASPPVLEQFSSMLSRYARIFTPYGATEALPVASIHHHEILADTAPLTNAGRGVCVGKPVDNIRARIIKISDAPIPAWSDDLQLPAGAIGEIVVEGPAVTREYFDNPAATTLAKIPEWPVASGQLSENIADAPSDHRPLTTDHFFHRMGDCGYFDAAGRLWFVGRKSHRVRLPSGELFSALEGIFNAHPAIARAALVGITRNNIVEPVLIVELERKWRTPKKKLTEDLLTLAQQHPDTRAITTFLFHPRFPVDIRHNAKINREQLAQWAQKKLNRS